MNISFECISILEYRLKAAQAEIKAFKSEKYVRMEQRALKAERRLDDALNKITEQRQRIYGLKNELEEEKGKRL